MIRTTVDIDLSRREIIQTDHLIFRCPELGDISQLMEFTTDPALIENAVTRVDFTPLTLAMFINRLPQPPLPKLTMFGLFFRHAPRELYGLCSYGLLEGNSVPRLSLWIRKMYRRRRAFAEIVPGLLDFAFCVHKLDAIQADAFPRQRMTPTLATKYGFTFIGYRREFAPMQGREIIMSVMELGRREWLEVHRSRFVGRSSIVHPISTRASWYQASRSGRT